MGLLRSRRIGLSALSLMMAACALHTAQPPVVGFVPIPRSFEARRAILIDKVRMDLRRQSPTFDDDILERVLAVMSQIPREDFLYKDARDLAYLDSPLPIGFGQTISDPHIVAVMTAAARLPAHANVLDIGTGSGFQAAVLSRLSTRVVSIEIVPQLARTAARRLTHFGYTNVSVRHGDGFLGSPVDGPYDAIIVAAGAARVPQPLIDQLKVGGRMVMPIGPSTPQEVLILITKRVDGKLDQCSLGPASFVPLTGIGQAAAAIQDTPEHKIPFCFGAPVS